MKTLANKQYAYLKRQFEKDLNYYWKNIYSKS